jgi:hypothetical protein
LRRTRQIHCILTEEKRRERRGGESEGEMRIEQYKESEEKRRDEMRRVERGGGTR